MPVRFGGGGRFPVGCGRAGRWADQFRKTLWQEALARYVTTAKSVAVIGDGTAWVWAMASHLFPYGVQMVDWYHLTEHLWEAAGVVHGEETPETAALLEG